MSRLGRTLPFGGRDDPQDRARGPVQEEKLVVAVDAKRADHSEHRSPTQRGRMLALIVCRGLASGIQMQPNREHSPFDEVGVEIAPVIRSVERGAAINETAGDRRADVVVVVVNRLRQWSEGGRPATVVGTASFA